MHFEIPRHIRRHATTGNLITHSIATPTRRHGERKATPATYDHFFIYLAHPRVHRANIRTPRKVGSFGTNDFIYGLSAKRTSRCETRVDSHRRRRPHIGCTEEGGQGKRERLHLMHRRIEGVATITTRLNENEKRIPLHGAIRHCTCSQTTGG